MTNFNEDSIDLELISKGDADTFARFYQRYRDRVYGFAYRMLRVRTAAEDVTHETFIFLIEHPEKYQKERASLLTFLCMVARSRILNQFRRRDYMEESLDDEEFHSVKIESAELDPLASLLEQELTEKVNEAISLLPPLQREAIILHKFQELTYFEISIVTEVEINVVKSRLFRARQNLAKNLAPYMSLKGDHCYGLRKS